MGALVWRLQDPQPLRREVSDFDQLPTSLARRMRMMQRRCERLGWSIRQADYDAERNWIEIEVARGASPADRVLRLAGRPDDMCLERFRQRECRKPAGRKGDRYISVTLEWDFLGRSRGIARDLLNEMGQYIFDNPNLTRAISGSTPKALGSTGVL